MPEHWTEQELSQEWHYIYNERLALLGCYGKPDPEQDKMARDDADKAVAELKSKISLS